MNSAEAKAVRDAKILRQQIAGWPSHLAGAKQGNPVATLCFHCYGRHAPPRDEICPHPAPKGISNASPQHPNRGDGSRRG